MLTAIIDAIRQSNLIDNPASGRDLIAILDVLDKHLGALRADIDRLDLTMSSLERRIDQLGADLDSIDRSMTT